VISAADNKVVGTVRLGGGPEFTIADGKGKHSRQSGGQERVAPDRFEVPRSKESLASSTMRGPVEHGI